MALFGTLFIAINAIILLVLFYNFYLKRRKLPPGPIPVPIFGNVLDIVRNPSGEKKHLEWSRKYGPVYTFWAGEIPVVCVADMDIMMNVFVKDVDSCIDRYYNVGVDTVTKGGVGGLVVVDGDLWREQRRFALHVFRDFGVGKNVMQEKILTELSSRMEKINNDLEADSNQEYNLAAVVDIGVGSVIASLLFGRRFDGETTKRFYQLKDYTSGLLSAISHPGMQFYLSAHPALAPIMVHLPLLGNSLREVRDQMSKIFEYLDEEIADHVANADSSAPPSDYCEAYWREMERRKLGDTDEQHFFTMNQLRYACLDLWVAGQETTSNTIAWGFAHLLYKPGVAKKVCEELDAVIGTTDRMITVADRPKLHYMNALISETQRVANLLPMNVLHKTSRDITINGYFIPKGVPIVPQISVPMCDDRVFFDPDVFNPDRFIDPATGQFVPSRHLMPFSMGKRQCLGESLARMELFLFMANILNQYTLEPASEMPSLKRILSATAGCPPFRCRMKRREVDHQKLNN